MNTTKLIGPTQPSEEPTFGEEFAEFLPWIAAVVVLGPIALISLVLWAPFLLLLTLVAAPALALGVIGIAVAILVLPVLGVRHGLQHFGPHNTKPSRAVSGVLSSTRITTFRSPLSGLPEHTTVGGGQ
jgi:hypothetical protein